MINLGLKRINSLHVFSIIIKGFVSSSYYSLSNAVALLRITFIRNLNHQLSLHVVTKV